MKKPEIPENESSRLETLRSLHILDTLPEERFDRVTRMAKKLFGVPIALVSLVDENRQWFKSCLGLDASETSREVSFCGHTILDNEVLIVPNASEDKRFADNPLVLNDPKIRFYAGYPLTVNGYKLGTLCIIDQVPRKFSDIDIETLIDLASMVERELAAVQLATLDELTDIPNRRSFVTLGQHSINLSLRQNFPITLVFIDLDKFKPINDSFGHAEGDNALIAIANLMKESFRDSDTFARLGGDEFAVLFSSTSQQQTTVIINRFIDSLNNYNQENKRGYTLSFSHGIVEFNPKLHNNIDDLLAAGDKIMYEYKNK